MDGWHLILNIIGKIFHAIWSYDFIIVSGNHIKIGNLVFAFVLSMLGLKYSKNFANFIKQYLKVKVSTDKDTANALEKIILYICFCLFVITILEIANVPLRTFAFIGGALAIGIGLGAQTLISNFISSLIVMIEKPLKIGDIIEIEGITGTVNSVGARCITLTTFTNVEVLVPNSKIMNTTLVNWTLSDNFIKHQMALKVSRDFFKLNDIEEFISNLQDILLQTKFFVNLFAPEINIVQIGEKEINFLINFACNLEEVRNPELVKNELNLILMRHLKNCDFTTEFLQTVEVKPVYDKSER